MLAAPERRIAIDRPDDPRIADYRDLRDGELRKRVEADTPGGLFITEGELAIRKLLTSRYPLRSVLVTEAVFGRLRDALATIGAPVYVAPLDVLRSVAGFDIHRGAVAAAGRLPDPPLDRVLAGARTVAVLEGLNDHENLGAIFRNAAGFGVDGVLLDPTCADPLYRRSIRVSLGHVLHVPFTRLPRWPDDLGLLTEYGFTVFALTPRPGAEDISALGHFGGRCAVLLGAEGPGLTDPAIAASRRSLRIPMAAGVDSLNVATAAAIAFYALRRGGGADQQPYSLGGVPS